jgi:hypothetical protein
MSKIKDTGSEFLLPRSYEYSPSLEPILVGTLDDILQQCKIPMLICQ